MVRLRRISRSGPARGKRRADMSFIDQLGLSVPVLQAPMAGVSTPALAAAVSNAGALGAIGLGATDAAGAQGMIEQVRARTERPFNVNLFVHATPQPDPQRRPSGWIGYVLCLHSMVCPRQRHWLHPIPVLKMTRICWPCCWRSGRRSSVFILVCRLQPKCRLCAALAPFCWPA